MMRDIVLGCSLPFETPADRRASEHILLDLLGAVCLVNLRYLDQNSGLPRLYDSGVTYCPPDQTTRPPLDPGNVATLRALLTHMGQEKEVQDLIVRILRGVEIFLDVPALYARGKGDCNELAPVRVAELWQAGVNAAPHLVKERNMMGGWTYHAVVKWPDGSQEDPSRILGMGEPDLRAEEIRKNAERYALHLGEGLAICGASGYPREALRQQMQLLGLLPRSGVFSAGGPAIDVRQDAAVLGYHRRHRRPHALRAA